MKSIAITGASGFVGKNLQRYLKNQYQINTMSVRYAPNQVFSIKENIVIHLAGKAHDLKNVSNPKDYYEANFELTKQLFDSFLDSEASIFIFLSTVKAVADEVNGVLTEESIPNPKTHYGIAKRQAEEYLLSKQLPVNKSLYILRPCMIHGPGNKGNLNLLYQFVSKGLPWPLGNFDNRRSFLSIDNLCFVISELLENGNIQSGIYQIADDKSMPTNELIQLIGKSLDQKSRIWKIPIFWIKLISALGDVFNLPLNSESLQKLTENYLVSNDKIKMAMGKPLPVTSEMGLITTLKSFKKV